MNTNNEMNIIRGILNEAFIQTQSTGKSFTPPKAASVFTPVSSVPATTPTSTSVPTPTAAGIQTKRPMSHEELMDMVKKSTAQTQDALQAGKRRDAAVADYRASAPAAPNDAHRNLAPIGNQNPVKHRGWLWWRGGGRPIHRGWGRRCRQSRRPQLKNGPRRSCWLARPGCDPHGRSTGSWPAPGVYHADRSDRRHTGGRFRPGPGTRGQIGQSPQLP